MVKAKEIDLTSAQSNSNQTFSPSFSDPLVDEFGDYQYTANQFLHEIRWVDDANINVITNLASSYICKKNDLKIVLESIDTGNKLILPYTNRFSPHYITRVNKKLDKIRKAKIHGVHLILTTDPSQHHDLITATKSIKKNWNRLASLLRKRYGKLHFITTLEFTSSYLPHLHVIIWGKKFVLPKYYLSQLWQKYGQGKITFIRQFTVNIAGYIMKYIRKQSEKLDYGALLWAMRMRAFSLSASVQKWLEKQPKSGERWQFLLVTNHDFGIYGLIIAGSEIACDIAYMLQNARTGTSVIA